MPRKHQAAVLAAVIAALVAAAPTAALPLGGSQHGQPQGLISSLWGALTSFWSAAGCEIDPSGKCVSSHGATLPARPGRGLRQERLVNVRGAAGCEIDPNGRLVSPTGGTCGAAVAGGALLATPR
jgi:hypothetical protein